MAKREKQQHARSRKLSRIFHGARSESPEQGSEEGHIATEGYGESHSLLGESDSEPSDNEMFQLVTNSLSIPDNDETANSFLTVIAMRNDEASPAPQQLKKRTLTSLLQRPVALTGPSLSLIPTSQSDNDGISGQFPTTVFDLTSASPSTCFGREGGSASIDRSPEMSPITVDSDPIQIESHFPPASRQESVNVLVEHMTTRDVSFDLCRFDAF